MKTNEAPEKIYLQPRTIEQLPHQNIVYTKPLADNSIEYIRADAFIDKAVKFMCNCIEDEMARHLEMWHPDMKAKTIERFRNYMKGK